MKRQFRRYWACYYLLGSAGASVTVIQDLYLANLNWDGWDVLFLVLDLCPYAFWSLVSIMIRKRPAFYGRAGFLIVGFVTFVTDNLLRYLAVYQPNSSTSVLGLLILPFLSTAVLFAVFVTLNEMQKKSPTSRKLDHVVSG